jgi:large subunit ribosomal protein L30
MFKPVIRIQQTGSPIRRHHSQRETLIGLGLNRIGRIAEVPYTRQTMGMIAKVRHLVGFPDADLYEQHRLVQPREVDEAADSEITRKLVFGPRDILLQRFGRKEMRGRRTPDFKLFKDGKPRGYCELKSPRDDWVFKVPEDLQPGEIREEKRPDPAAHNLANHILNAAEQFDAVNPDRTVPNILVIVSHARLRGPLDLRHTLEGIQLGEDGRRVYPLADPEKQDPDTQLTKQKKVWKAAQSIDLYIWIDAHDGTWTYRLPAGAKRLKEACELLDIDPKK